MGAEHPRGAVIAIVTLGSFKPQVSTRFDMLEARRQFNSTSEKRCLASTRRIFHSFAALSLNPEELRLTVSRHLGVDWDPESVGHPFSRQAVFVGVYDA
jgi:hypothetical protein